MLFDVDRDDILALLCVFRLARTSGLHSAVPIYANPPAVRVVVQIKEESLISLEVLDFSERVSETRKIEFQTSA